jgi:polyhydroxyalkanoate synthesis regulator phasin
MNTVGERLEYARKQKGLTYDKLGSYVNVGGDAVRASIKRNSIKDYYLNVFSDKLHICRDWLLTGEGEMLGTTSESTNGMKEVIDFLDAQSKMGGSSSNKALEEENKYHELSTARKQVIVFQREEIERLKEEIERLKEELKNP